MPPPRRRSVERVDAADAARLAASRLRSASTSAKTQQHRPPKRARTRPGAAAPPDDSAPPPGAPRGDLETFQRLVLGPLLWRRPEASELGDIPLSFRDASHYVRAFEPALLEETREGVRGAWLESIGERRQFPLRLQHLAPVGSGWRRATLVPDDRRDVDAIRSLCPPSATSPNAVCVLCEARVEGEDPWPRAVRGVDLPLAVAGFVERVARDPPTVEVKFFVSDEVDVDVDRNARSFEPWHEEIRLRERATLEAFEGVRRDVRGSDGRRAAADVPADDAEAAEAGEIVDDASARDPPRGGAGRRWFLAPAGKLSSASTSYEALCNVRRLHPPMRDALMRRLRRDDDASLEGAANGADDDEDARFEDASGARPRAAPPLAPPPFAEEVEAHPKFAEFLRASFNDPQLDAIRWSTAHTSRAWARATQGRRGGNEDVAGDVGGTNAAESGPEVLNLLRTPASPFTLVQGPPGTGKTHTVWGILNVLHIVLFARYQSALHRAIVEHADRGREAEEDGTFFPEDVSADDAADETARWASGFDALHAEDNGGGGSGRNAATTVTELYASLARDAGVRRGRERVFGRTKPRILVCASSNAAVDNLLERVFVRGFTQLDGASAYRPPVVRVGASDAVVAEGVAAVCASTLVEDLIARGEREWDREYRKHDAFQREAAACIRAHERAHRDAGVEKARRSRDAGDALEPCELVRLREEDDARVREMCRLHEDRNKAVADMARLAYLLTHAREKEKGSGGGVGEGGDAEPRSTTRERVGSSAGERALSRRHRVVLEASFVDQAEIVFTTLASSARDVFRRQLTHGFDTVLVDEAAQASETQTLVPFLLGAERCVLVGDPRQLPSTVLSGAAQEAKLQRSLFERFSKLGARIVLLSVQYRMHPEIRRFPSEAFYDGRLEDARSVLDREAADPLFFRGAGARGAEAERDGDALLSRPYVFFDAASGSASRTGGKTRNVVEAVLVACLYRALAEKLKRRNGDGANANANANASRGPRVVAVITPYRQQRVAILDAFAALCGGTGAAARLGVVVSTVDGFQGREADVVIFSAVRGGEGGGGGGGGASRGVGFLKDVRRVNVALTRAKRALWIVGHAEGLRRSGTIWETLVEDAERRGCVVRNADEREDVLGGATSAGERDDAIRRLEGGRDAPRRFGGGWGGDRGDRGVGGRRRGGRDDEAGWGWGAPPPPPPREARD